MEASQKKILRALSLQLRHTLEGSYAEDGTWNAGDLERRLNQIGIWRDRQVKPISEMPNLSSVDRKTRELIDAYLTLRSDAGVSQSDAVAEFIRESAYSWANRLFALRCMEARGIIDPVILQEETYQGRSMVHNRFAQRKPAECTGEDDGLFAMLLEEFRERSRELPDLFAPDSPAVALRPSIVALKNCIALLSGSIPANGGKATDEVFIEADAFGWAYQYWNAEEKDRVFEMVRTKKGAKIEGSDIIPATQLYTEPYMVKFLVQNSLGATWMMMHPESKISATWEYYVKDADRTPNEKKPIAEITFLDPACGSGHFLIEAFDLLYAMYEEEGQLKDPEAICQSILNNNLFGIDIDERAVQITKAVLWMKAAEMVFAKTKKQLVGVGLSEFHDHIIATNIRLPHGKDHLDGFLKKHPEDVPLRPALLTVFEGLKNVHELGSLVQIEEPVEKELIVLKEQAKQQKFDPESGEIVEKVNFPRWKQQVIKRLKDHFQEEAEKASPSVAFFSQSAVKGLALFDLLARRYDVVAANPPYMGSKNMGARLKSYVEAHYFEGKRDLYAAFILRDLELTERNGRLAMVTQQSWLFLQSYAKMRAIEEDSCRLKGSQHFSGLLRDTRIDLVSHLGENAFDDPAAAGAFVILFTLQREKPTKTHRITAFRLIGYTSAIDKRNGLLNTLKNKTNLSFSPLQADLILTPSSSFIYWLNPSLFRFLLYHKDKRFGEKNDIFLGVRTANDIRFVRYSWEANSQGGRWLNYQKGGGYCKWYGFTSKKVDWQKAGIRIKSYISEKFVYLNGNFGLLVRGEKNWNNCSITYTDVARGSFSARKMGSKDIPSDDGPGIFTTKNEFETLSLLNSRFVTFLMRILSPSIFHFGKGYVELLPNPINEDKRLSIYGQVAYEYKIHYNNNNLLLENYHPSNQIFHVDSLNYFFKIECCLLFIEYCIEKCVNEIYKLEKSDIEKIYIETGNPAGSYPFIVNYDSLPPEIDNLNPSIEVSNIIDEQPRIIKTKKEIIDISKRLRAFFEAGPGSRIEGDDGIQLSMDDNEDNSNIGARIPIPPETFIEELSQKMEIHPISIYWLLKEGIDKEGWRCIPEEKRYTEDFFSVIVLRLLGHRWPKQIEAGEPVSEWANPDGIIPITAGLTHPVLLQQVRDRIAEKFPHGKAHEIEKEFEEVVGMPLERWLAGEFFKHHVSQFKKRPIAWQLSSTPAGIVSGKGKGRGSRREPAFSCLVYYHKIDADILHKIRTQYVWDLINRYGTELRALEARKELTSDQASRKVQLDNWIAELKDFSETLQNVADNGFSSKILKEIVAMEPLDKWTSRDGKVLAPKIKQEFEAQEKRYDPDINDGVRVNIAPLQKAGLLSAEVIAKKDLEKAIEDRAEWRADERRWCREGKLPKCGWWE